MEDASKIFIYLDKLYFTNTYKVMQFSEISAELEDIYCKKLFSIEPTLKDFLMELKSVALVLYYVAMKIGQDRLYFDKKTWSRFRAFGILPENSRIKFKITHVITEEGRVEVFPRREVFF